MVNRLVKTKVFLSVFITLVGILSISTSVQAEGKKLIYESSRQGIEWKVYLVNKRLVKKLELGGENRRLYLIDLEVNSSYDGITRQTNLVQCSTSKPFVAFKSDFEQQIAVIDVINPGGSPYGYNSGSHWIYWAVCHNLWQPWDYDLESRATRLGYSTELESEQIQIPYGLLQYLK
ncbi:hypothetical protein [Chroococcidiopsis sp. TS-821]|uniref:hypothetical protein n=1 Tax=Chroococcidiopsis sp. TS-821 TaxID=1378066 RepID=UPI000CEDCBBF|nr:hypothetical protein [Chroococcidiopsis sp. TS-821]PPS43923.1 hypothetical protein B1A85_08015 [Chroococcidiopsis sp. TS-821]